jgi:hypothetical protein
MHLTRLGLALLGILALGAVVANTAMATATESNGFWYVKGSKLPPGEKGPITCSQVGESTLTTTAGAKKTPVKIKATGTTCPESVIFNEGSKAKGSEKIKLTGVTVVEPAGCVVAGGEIETAKLSYQVYMEGTKVLVRFAPASETVFAEAKITKCSIEGSYPIKGVLFGEWGKATEVESAENSIAFAAEINAAAGGSLTFAGQPLAVTANTLHRTSHKNPPETEDEPYHLAES